MISVNVSNSLHRPEQSETKHNRVSYLLNDRVMVTMFQDINFAITEIIRSINTMLNVLLQMVLP